MPDANPNLLPPPLGGKRPLRPYREQAMQEPRGAIAIDASPLAVGGVPASWSRRRHDRWSARASVMLPSAAPTGDTVTVDRIDSQERVAQERFAGPLHPNYP